MSRRSHSPYRSALLIAMAALALGCLGRSPTVHYYTMSLVGNAQGDRSDLSVGLGPITLPDYLDRPQIVTRTRGSELRIDEQQRWAGGFRSNLTETLADDLRTRLGSDLVFLDASASPSPVAFQVAVDIRQFEAREGEGLVLRARWIVREKIGLDRAWTRESTIRQESSGGGVQGQIDAYDAALGRLADQIAAQILGAL